MIARVKSRGLRALKASKTFPIVVAYLIFIVIGIASGLLNIAWTYMQGTFGVSHDSLAALAPAAMLGGLFAAFMSGALIGRFTLAPVLVGGMAIAGIGLLGYAVAPVWLLLLTVAFITSMGKGTIDAGFNNFVSSNYGASEMNWLHACWGIGLTIAPALVTFFVLDQGGGWQSSYLVTGAAVLLLGALMLFTLPLWQLRADAAERVKAKRQPMFDSLRQPIVLIGLLFFFLYGGIEIGTGQLANTLLTEARALPQEIASSWVSAYWGSFTVGRILMGLLAIRLGDRLLLQVSFALSVAGAALLFLNPSEALSFAGLLGIGFGLAAMFPILILQTNARVGVDHAANAIGFQVGCAGLGGAALSGLGGIFAEHVGAESISLFILIGAAMAALIYWLMLRFEANAIRKQKGASLMPSLAQKVGRMLMVGFEGLSPPAHILEWLAEGRIGGVYLFARNVQSPAQVRDLAAACRAAADFPILVGIDQEGGVVARLKQGFTQSPGAMALGAAGDTQLAEESAAMLGRELAALGINWNFAPVADIAHHPDNPSVGARSVGRDPALASQIVAAQVRGFQRSGVAATVKHFPGLGNTVIDTHVGMARVRGSLDYLYEADLQPFRAAIAADVACVMLTHVIYDRLDRDHPATMSPRIVTDLLRGELEYAGAISTDCMEMKAIQRVGAGESAVRAVLAGVDLPLFSHTRQRQEAAHDALLEAAQSGRISAARLDASLARIAAMKSRFPLVGAPPLSVVGCREHDELAMNAARAGVVAVKGGDALAGLLDGSIASIEFSAARVSDAVEAQRQRIFSDALQTRLPEARCLVVDPDDDSSIDDDVLAADALILLTRNAHLQPVQLRRARDIVSRARRVILVCARNPYDAALLDTADAIICTNGDSAPSMRAAVEAICGDFRPSGRLTVTLR